VASKSPSNADSVSPGAASPGLTGYSIVEAESIDAAAKLAASCPLLSSGGTLEIYEAMPM